MNTDQNAAEAAPAPVPIPMVLFCPRCAMQHIDSPQPEKGWTNPPHKSHECQSPRCGYVWRPADVHTVGVEAIATRGSRDRSASPREARGQLLASHAELLATTKHLRRVITSALPGDPAVDDAVAMAAISIATAEALPEPTR